MLIDGMYTCICGVNLEGEKPTGSKK